MRARTDLDFLLYPLATEEEPTCSACGAPMTIAVHEARGDRPDFRPSGVQPARGPKGLCWRTNGPPAMRRPPTEAAFHLATINSISVALTKTKNPVQAAPTHILSNAVM
jgi:hypothetical protein